MTGTLFEKRKKNELEQFYQFQTQNTGLNVVTKITTVSFLKLNFNLFHRWIFFLSLPLSANQRKNFCHFLVFIQNSAGQPYTLSKQIVFGFCPLTEISTVSFFVFYVSAFIFYWFVLTWISWKKKVFFHDLFIAYEENIYDFSHLIIHMRRVYTHTRVCVCAYACRST